MGSIWRDAPSLEMLATPTLMTAHQVGALKIMVRTGWGEGSLTAFKHRYPDAEPDYIAADLWKAAQYLIDR